MVKSITGFLLVLKKTDITLIILTLYQCVTHASPYCCSGNRQVLFLGLVPWKIYMTQTLVCNIVITDKYLKLTLQLWTPELSQIKKNENSFTAKQHIRLCATK